MFTAPSGSPPSPGALPLDEPSGAPPDEALELPAPLLLAPPLPPLVEPELLAPASWDELAVLADSPQ
jgi:hypothetical protein